jgi:hypothetical protein
MRFFTAQHAGLAVYRVALLFSNPRHLFRKFGADTPFFQLPLRIALTALAETPDNSARS